MRGLLYWLRGRLPRAARAYKSPVTRASSTAIAGVVAITVNPYAGLALEIGDAAVLSIADQFLEGNPQELARLTNERIEAIKDRDRYDEDFVETAEFHGAVVQALLASAQETEREKIDLYAEVLAGATSRDRPDQLDLRALLSTLVSLSLREVQLARSFYLAYEKKKGPFAIGGNKPAWGPDTDFYLKHLEGIGLIASQIGANLIGTTYASYHPTATFDRLMGLLSEGRSRSGGRDGNEQPT
ncbi:MAG: hypothetical protein QOH92_1407 [Chloroflexota bacterium]|jgi:hypothetical protein|nr:hypothetical protein [Chloroflexota bacterium]